MFDERLLGGKILEKIFVADKKVLDTYITRKYRNHVAPYLFAMEEGTQLLEDGNLLAEESFEKR